MGSIITKYIAGHGYQYYVYYDGGKRIEKYCGLNSKPKSGRMAKKFELEDLLRRKNIIIKKIAAVRKEIKK